MSGSSRTPGESGDASPDALIGISLGREIRAARTAQKLSMRAVASAAEISQPFLSQIESGNTMPSVVTLFRIANALGISPSALFPSEAEPDPITLTRRDQGKQVQVSETDDGAISRIISSGTSALATVQEYRIANGPYVGDWFESDGDVTVYVVEGTVTVTFDGRGAWELSAGDALAHPGAYRNRWTVAGPDPVTILLVYAVAP